MTHIFRIVIGLAFLALPVGWTILTGSPYAFGIALIPMIYLAGKGVIP